MKKLENYSSYEEYVAACLKEADEKAADGTMKYHTADEVRKELETVLTQHK